MPSSNNDIRIITGKQVAAALDGQEKRIINIIEQAYIAHACHKTVVPHSLFLRFPDESSNRIIALPAYIQTSDDEMAGIKWVASFPNNINHGLDRASATLVLNSMETGRPYCFMEASLINMHRTAASAALAARLVMTRQEGSLTLIGCGPINASVARYIHAVHRIKTIHLYDTSTERAEHLSQEIVASLNLPTKVHTDLQSALQASDLVSFATNVSTPFVEDVTMFKKGSTILHISLRDISPDIIASSDNIVDDISHVNRESTSIHLASLKHGTTNFITATIGELAQATRPRLAHKGDLTIVSPFGLGMLDIALGHYVYSQVIAAHQGTVITDFFQERG